MTPNTADPSSQYRSPGFTYQSNPTTPSQMTAPTIVTTSTVTVMIVGTALRTGLIAARQERLLGAACALAEEEYSDRYSGISDSLKTDDLTQNLSCSS